MDDWFSSDVASDMQSEPLNDVTDTPPQCPVPWLQTFKTTYLWAQAEKQKLHINLEQTVVLNKWQQQYI